MAGQTRIDSNLIDTGTDPNDIVSVSVGDGRYPRLSQDNTLAGDTAKQQEIAAKKQSLRDVTVDPVIDAATTPDELKAVRPSALQDLKTD
jgi:hypothetical protein